MHYEIFHRARRRGHEYVAARFWNSQKDFLAMEPPVLINDFKLHLRTEHQRIRRGPAGGLLHRGGAEVQPAQCRSFLESGEAIPWQRDDEGRILRDARGYWKRRGENPLAPFRLAVAGREENFNPEWVREAFTAELGEAINTELRAYACRALVNGWTGDCRGTTLVYQVGNSADDGAVDSLESFDAAADSVLVGESPGYTLTNNAWYRFAGVSGVGGRTIASAFLSLWGYADDVGAPGTKVLFEAAASPAAPVTYPDYWVRARSSAVAWNSPGLSTGGFTQSPELKAILQEVADAYTPTALLVFHEDNGSTDGTCNPWAYDGDTTRAAKLTIDNGEMFRPFRRRPIYER